MSRVFILSANTTVEPYPVYPLGMAVIASALSEKGHEVRQFDFLASGACEEKLRSELKAFGPDMVCISLRNIDNVDSFTSEKEWYLARGKEQVRWIRECCDAPVILGGPAFSIMPEEILEFLGADYGIVGEGETLLCELVEALGRGRSLPRILTGEDRAICGKEMASPLYEPSLVEFYLAESGILNLQTKRGCPFRCTYCTYPSLEGKVFRHREPRAVVDDMEKAARDHGVKDFFFTDSVFNDPKGRYLEIAEELIDREIPLRWSAFFRPRGMGRKEFALLKRSGLHAVELGTDAACDVTLEGIGKDLTFEEVVEVSEACLAEEVPCAHFVMFGGPGETEETVREGLVNIERLGKAVVFAFSGIRILSGTGVQTRAVEEGLIPEGASLLKPMYYFSPGIDAERMNAMILENFSRHRHRIFPPSSGREKMEVMRNFGFRGILWDKLISFRKRT